MGLVGREFQSWKEEAAVSLERLRTGRGVATWWVLLCLGGGLLAQGALGPLTDPLVQEQAGALQPDRVLRQGESWRLISRVWVASDWPARLAELLAAAQLGPLVEQRQGTARATLLFLVPTLLAGLLSLGDEGGPLVGAVGPVPGLLGWGASVAVLALLDRDSRAIPRLPWISLGLVLVLNGTGSLKFDAFGWVVGALVAVGVPRTRLTGGSVDWFFSGIGLALCGAALAGLVRAQEPTAVRARWLAERAVRLAIARPDDEATAAALLQVERLLPRVERREANALWWQALPKVRHHGALELVLPEVTDPLRREAVLRQRVVVDDEAPSPLLDLAEHLVRVPARGRQDPQRALNLVQRARSHGAGAPPGTRERALEIELQARARLQELGRGIGLGSPPP